MPKSHLIFWPCSLPRSCAELLIITTLFIATAATATPKGTASADQLALIARATEHESDALENPLPF
jgi:hypothetical protein